MNSTSSSPLKTSNSNTAIEQNKILYKVHRSASFNETCTVPVKVTAQSKVKNSPSFTNNCSLKAKIASARSSLDRKLIGGRDNKTQIINSEQTVSCLSIVKDAENKCVDYYV